jgi:hypothetical protein
VSVTTTAPAPPDTAVAGWRSRLVDRARVIARLAVTDHKGLTILVGAGTILRILVMIGYQPALWFHGDSGVYLRQSARFPPPIDPYRPTGYTLFLKLLRPTETLYSVVALQHLAGLAVAVAVYVFLQRRGLPRWLSALATVPLIFDSLQVSLEHFILVESMFTSLLLATFLVFLWTAKPGTKLAIIGGVLLFAAWFTKPLALPIVPIIVVYLLLRRVGWRPVVGFLLAFLAPYAVVQVLVAGYNSVYGSNSSAIYGRAASIADCSKIEVTPEQRVLCPAPDQLHQRPDWYNWADEGPGAPYRGKNQYNALLQGFAITVLTQQPGDYLRQVGKETAAHFVPGIDLGPSYGCLRERFTLPATARDTRPLGEQCHAQLASGDFGDTRRPEAFNPPANGLTVALAAYSSNFRPDPVVNLLGVVLTLAALVYRRRGAGWSATRDSLLLVASSLALIVLPVLIGMYEARYALPALPLMCIAAALSLQRLRAPDPAAPRDPRAPQPATPNPRS